MAIHGLHAHVNEKRSASMAILLATTLAANDSK